MQREKRRTIGAPFLYGLNYVFWRDIPIVQNQRD
jgi:hypothetical protein